MPLRLVALDEGPDIPIDREMLVIGRHPQCDARLDSIRVSRRHCCMTQDNGELIVRDLGSTNGIRINGQRVEKGRLRIHDELAIAHIRYRLDDGQVQDLTQAEPSVAYRDRFEEPRGSSHRGGPDSRRGGGTVENNPLAAAVRDMLPPGVADRCRIQVIVQMQPDHDSGEGSPPGPGLDSDEHSDERSNEDSRLPGASAAR